MVSRTRARVKPAALQAGQADSGSDSDSQEEGAMADTPPPPRARARAKQKRAASHALTYEAREKKRRSFMEAVAAGDVAAAREMIGCPAFAEWSKGFVAQHPVHVAIRTRQPEMLKFLLDEACFSPDAMATLPNYMVALHVAVLGNSVWAAVMLLDRGANAAIRNVSSRETPIDLALRLRNVAVATALFSRGAVYSEDSRVMREGRDFLLDARLHVAAMLNRPDAIQALLESGQLEADARVKGGFTAAHLAALFGSAQALQELLTNPRFRPSAILCRTEHLGRAPLHLAAMTEDAACLRLLLQKSDGDDHVNVEDQAGRTPLAMAVTNDRREQTEALLAAGANPNVADQNGDTVLHLAIRPGNSKCEAPTLRLLLGLADESKSLPRRVPCLLEAQNHQNATALALAAWGSAIWALAPLLEAGADVVPGKGFRAPLRSLELFFQTRWEGAWEQVSVAFENYADRQEALIDAHEQGTSPLAKAERLRARVALDIAGAKMSACLGAEAAVLREKLGRQIRAFRAAPAAEECVLPDEDDPFEEADLPFALQRAPWPARAPVKRCAAVVIVEKSAKRARREEPQTKAAAARAEAAKTYADQALVQRAPVLECAAEEPGNAVTRRQCGREVRATGALLAAAWSEMAAASVEYRDARAAAARHKAAEAVAADIRAARRRIALVRKFLVKCAPAAV